MSLAAGSLAAYAFERHEEFQVVAVDVSAT